MDDVYVFFPSKGRFHLTQFCLNQLINSCPGYALKIFVFDMDNPFYNEERTKYFTDLLYEGKIHQYTYLSDDYCDNHFSKVVAWNKFVEQVEGFPIKWLLLIDSDIFVHNNFLAPLIQTLEDLKKYTPNLYKDTYFTTQFPGGVMFRHKVHLNGRVVWKGRCGGSGLLVAEKKFITDIGKLNKEFFKGKTKEFDQRIWVKCHDLTKKDQYAIAIPDEKIALHLGGLHTHSICNILKLKNLDPEKRLQMLREAESFPFEGMDYDQIAERWGKKVTRW